MRQLKKNSLKAFLSDEAGAVTVDWVVLTAAIVGLGFILLVPIAFSTTGSAQSVATYIGDLPVGFGK